MASLENTMTALGLVSMSKYIIETNGRLELANSKIYRQEVKMRGTMFVKALTPLAESGMKLLAGQDEDITSLVVNSQREFMDNAVRLAPGEIIYANEILKMLKSDPAKVINALGLDKESPKQEPRKCKQCHTYNSIPEMERIRPYVWCCKGCAEKYRMQNGLPGAN